MITLDVEQNSEEWLYARLGIPTASEFGRILTPKTMKLSASSEGYIDELIAERLLGEPLEDNSSTWMARGHKLEESARRYYEFVMDCKVSPGGFVLLDNRQAGCSPDGFVGDDGGVEVKCPSAKGHVGYLRAGLPAKFMPQVQGCMWITGRKWWDLMSYNPAIPPVIVRIERDDAYIGKLSAAVLEFVERLEDASVKCNVPSDWRDSLRPPMEPEDRPGYEWPADIQADIDAGKYDEAPKPTTTLGAFAGF